jgi:DNA-binding CsgD family transcriptional regulator
MALVQIAAAHDLTPRETQVLAAALYGVPRKHLASSLGIGENTLKTYATKLNRKLGTTSIDDAVWSARRHVARFVR